jgi:hypothetical protein
MFHATSASGARFVPKFVPHLAGIGLGPSSQSGEALTDLQLESRPAAKELKELREQNARLKRLLAEAELVKDALREVAKILSPAAKRRAVDMLTTTFGMSERLACKAVGLARSTHRRVPRSTWCRLHAPHI